MRKFLRLVCALLCLTLLPLSALAADTPAEIRVLLRRLNLTDRADLILDGVYTAHVDGESLMAFPKGAEVTILIRSGQLFLFYEGMSMKLGGEVELIRNASQSQDSEGIRFAKGGSYYPGDLRLTIEGGLLQPVMTLGLEDYLLGVVPHEMSNSFPLEALKAQAVCARTYALRRVDPSKQWDVVDTTNDQVFKGVDPDDVNAHRAVKETAGIVGTYKGKLADCFYSASNGGQTELVKNVWSGGGDYGYYAMVDDPYDVENPESVVRKARIPKKGDLSASLRGLLMEEMVDAMRSRGFTVSTDCLRIDSVTGVKLSKPRFASPSRLMTQITLTFTWSGRKILGSAVPRPTTPDEELLLFSTVTPQPAATATPAPDAVTPAPTATPTPAPVYSAFEKVKEPMTVTLDLFPQGVKALNISVYGADNELVTVSETEAHFVVEARRYGHGLGMSQRGAQWMASRYGKTFAEILAFYYPGMELMQASLAEPVLPTAEPDLVNTPAPPATPTPRPTLMPVTESALPAGAYLATVENIEDDSSLNLRQEPSTASVILMRLYKHQPLIVLETCEDPAWVRVKTDVIEGYVMHSFLEPVE